MVETIAERASDIARTRQSIQRLQIFLVKYESLRSLQLCEDQSMRVKLKKRVCNHVFAILTTYMETRLNPILPEGGGGRGG